MSIWQGVARGHGLAMPYLFTPCGWATPETALWLFWGWPACKAGGLRPSSTPLDTPRRTPVHDTPLFPGSSTLLFVLRTRADDLEKCRDE
jgi:hypothetical protein